MKRIFHRIKEPRVQAIGYFLLYALLGLAGAAAAVNPPLQVYSVLGEVTYIWATFDIIAGVLGMITVLPGWWWAERIAAVSGIVGSVLYAIAIIGIQAEDTAINKISGWAYVCIPIVLLSIRLYETRRYAFDPQKG